jgi:hypothetical protein
VSPVIQAGAVSIAPLPKHVRDRRLSDQKRGPDDYWVKMRKRHRLSAEATATGPEKTDIDKRDPKRMRESQSPRTTAQKLIAEDELVPMPHFISAKELAERKAREAQEKDERRRVNFAGPSQDQQMEEVGFSGVQNQLRRRPRNRCPKVSHLEPTQER